MIDEKKIEQALLSAVSNVQCEMPSHYSKEELKILRESLEKKEDTKSLIYRLVQFSSKQNILEEKGETKNGKSKI